MKYVLQLLLCLSVSIASASVSFRDFKLISNHVAGAGGFILKPLPSGDIALIIFKDKCGAAEVCEKFGGPVTKAIVTPKVIHDYRGSDGHMLVQLGDNLKLDVSSELTSDMRIHYTGQYIREDKKEFSIPFQVDASIDITP